MRLGSVVVWDRMQSVRGPWIASQHVLRRPWHSLQSNMLAERSLAVATGNVAQLEEITVIVESIAADMPGVLEMRRRAAAQNARRRDARPGFFATVVRKVREKIGRVLT